MTQNLLFAGGAWKWLGYFPGNGFSMHVADLAHASCRKNGVDRALVTAWADNGAECSPFAVLPTLQYWAELCYQNGPAQLERHFSSCCQGADLQSFLCLDEPQYTPATQSPAGCRSIPPNTCFTRTPVRPVRRAPRPCLLSRALCALRGPSGRSPAEKPGLLAVSLRHLARAVPGAGTKMRPGQAAPPGLPGGRPGRPAGAPAPGASRAAQQPPAVSRPVPPAVASRKTGPSGWT